MRAGVPQGTLLGPLIFLALIDDALRDQRVKRWKYVDDMSIADNYKLPGHTSDDLLDSLATLESWCTDNYVKLNPKKCSVLQVSFSKAPVPDPDISLCGQKLNLVKHTKILGVIVQDDLKWDMQVDNMVSRASRRLFMLRSLKAFKLPIEDMLTVYITFIRPVLEYACPVWHCALTQSQQKRMERIQKRSLRIILSYQYLSYDQALSLTGLETLHERRQFLCLTFARKVFKSNRTEQWFLPSNSTRNLRNNRICLEPKYKTDRYRNSTIPFLTRLLNTYGLI